MLGTMARAIQPGKTALLAEATEPAVEVIDSEMVASAVRLSVVR